MSELPDAKDIASCRNVTSREAPDHALLSHAQLTNIA
jgi:hypothetical protein